MQNFSTATEATNTALNSAGSASKENAAYMEGLEAKTNKVAASFEKLANTVVDSETVKTVLDGINLALTALNTPLGSTITKFTLLTGVITGAIGVFGPIVSNISGMFKAFKNSGSILTSLSNLFKTTQANAMATGTAMTAVGAAASGAGVAAKGAATGFAAFSAAAAPIAAIIAGVVVAVQLAGSAIDYFTTSIEEQQETVSNLSNEISNLKSEYDQLSSKEDLTASDERRLQVLEAQIKANEILLQQEAQKQYDMQFGKESSGSDRGIFSKEFWTTPLDEMDLTGVERIKEDIKQLKEYQKQIEEVENKIINLDEDSQDYTKTVEQLTDYQESLTEDFNNLNNEVSSNVQELSTLGETLGGLPSDAEQVIDSYLQLTDDLNATNESAKTLTETLQEISNVQILPKDAENMEDWLQSMSSSDFIKLQTILKGLGNDASAFSEILSNMGGEDAIRVINAAYKEYYGTVESGTEALTNFQKALEINYGEGLASQLQALDYVNKSQQEGIQNYQAYKEAMIAAYGTMEVTAQDQERYTKSYMSYFKDGAFQAQVFAQKLQDAEGAWSEYVDITENANGSMQVNISDFSDLAESLDLTEPMLWQMLEAMKAYGDVNISDNINAGQVALQDLAETLEDKGSKIRQEITQLLGEGSGGFGITDNKIQLDAEFNIDIATEQLEEVQNKANELLKNTGFQFDFDINTANAEEALVTIYNTLSTIQNYIDDSGNWDFSGLVESATEIEGVTIDGSNISFETDEAAQKFAEQLVGQISSDTETQAEQLDIVGTIFKNMENSGYTFDFSKVVDTDTSGQTIASKLVASINTAISTEQIAWGDSIIQGADNVGAQLDTTKSKADDVKNSVDQASTSVSNLNKKSLGSVTKQLGNAGDKAGTLKTNLNQSLSYLNNLTGKQWTISTVWQTTGTPPSAPEGGSQSANGMETKGNKYKPLKFTNAQDDLVGENGEELLISKSGQQKLVGVNGPEFISVKPGDTIIPANVTAMIKSGKIGSYAGGKTSASGSWVSNIGPISVGEVTSLYDGEVITSSSSTSSTKKNTSATKENTQAKSSSSKANQQAANSTEELTDAIEEQTKAFDEQNAITEHNIFIRGKQGASTKELVALNKAYQDQIHQQAEWFRSQGLEETSEQIRDAQKQWWSIYDDIIDLQRDSFDERLKDSEDYIDERNDLDDWGADNEIAAWNRVVEWMDEWYSQGLIDYEYYLEKRTEAAKKAAEAEKEAWLEAKQAQVDDLKEQVNIYEILFSAVADRAQEEIDALQSHRDEVEEYWNNKIDALQQANDELDDQIEKEEALDALARARQTKVMVYKDGRFQYINDLDEVSDAQANLDKIERDETLKKELENLEELRDKELASIDEQIEGWEQYKDEWSSVVDDYEKEQDRLLLEQELGIKLEGDNWEERLDNLESYVERYKELLKELEIAEEELEEEEELPSGGGGGSSTGSTVGGVVGGTTGSIMGPVGGIVGGIGGSIVGGIVGGLIDKVTSSSSSSSSSSSKGKTYNETASGNAPAQAQIGDTIHTSGGDYKIVSSNTPGASYNPSSGRWSIKTNATGTTNFEGGMSLTGEEGPELEILPKGTGIIPSNITKNLWSWGTITPQEMIQRFHFNPNENNGTIISIDKFAPNLPNVQNGEDFVTYLSTHFKRQVIQYTNLK